MSVRSVVPTIAGGQFLRRRGVREIALIGALYVFYCFTRTFAEDDLGPPRTAPATCSTSSECSISTGSTPSTTGSRHHSWAAVPASYWYAAAHYVVTLTVLVWLFRKGAAHYSPARWALVVSCLIALACYLLLPTAPPRLFSSGYVDILSLHSDVGWWGTDASAPKGMGQLTNELAAFPSLHAGWALWVALVVRRNTTQLLAARPGLDARLHHRRGRDRHRQPLDPRRRRRLGRGDRGDVAGRPVVPRRRSGTAVLVEFHDRLAAEASSPPIVLEAEREPEPMAGADREQPQGCRRRYDTDG